VVQEAQFGFLGCPPSKVGDNAVLPNRAIEFGQDAFDNTPHRQRSVCRELREHFVSKSVENVVAGTVENAPNLHPKMIGMSGRLTFEKA
jgi:hypothetical protein